MQIYEHGRGIDEAEIERRAARFRELTEPIKSPATTARSTHVIKCNREVCEGRTCPYWRGCKAKKSKKGAGRRPQR